MGELLDTIWIQGEAAELGIIGDGEADRRRARPDQETELQNRSRLPEIPQDVALHPGRRRRAGEAAAAQHRDPGTDRQKTCRRRRAARSAPTTTRRSTQFTQPATRDIRLVLNKDKAKVEQAQAALEKDDSPRAGRRSPRSTRPTRRRRPTAGCRRAQQRPGRGAAERGHLRRPKASSRARSRPTAATTSSRSRTRPRRTSRRSKTVAVPDQLPAAQQTQQDAFSDFVADYGASGSRAPSAPPAS